MKIGTLGVLFLFFLRSLSVCVLYIFKVVYVLKLESKFHRCGGSDKVFGISFTRQFPLTLRVDPGEPTVGMDTLGSLAKPSG